MCALFQGLIKYVFDFNYIDSNEIASYTMYKYFSDKSYKSVSKEGMGLWDCGFMRGIIYFQFRFS